MWYVIHTKTGEEARVVEYLNRSAMEHMEEKCFVPVFEKVNRTAQSWRIFLQRLFPGYVFVNTYDPEGVIAILRRLPLYTRMLGARDEDDLPTFMPVEEAEEQFLRSLLSEGILHVSYIEMKKHRIEKVIGPLSDYVGSIHHLDLQHRRAMVEKDVFGKHRKICFGLVTANDPEHAWLRRQMESGDAGKVPRQTYDIGLQIGDQVRGSNGIYEDREMTVIDVDAVRRQITVEVEMFGRKLPLLMFADHVEKMASMR